MVKIEILWDYWRERGDFESFREGYKYIGARVLFRRAFRVINSFLKIEFINFLTQKQTKKW